MAIQAKMAVRFHKTGIDLQSLRITDHPRYRKICPEALAESALSEAETLEKCGFSSIILSIKSSDVKTTVSRRS